MTTWKALCDVSGNWREIPLRLDRSGSVPISAEALAGAQSTGEIFDYTMAVAAGVPIDLILSEQIHLLSCAGGIRESKLLMQQNDSGEFRYRLKSPEERAPREAQWKNFADFGFGFHSGHTELLDLSALAGAYLQTQGYFPKYSNFTGACDGVMQGRDAMSWSLLYRDLATEAFAMQLRMNPAAKGILGFAGCDKETPGLVGALGRLKELPAVLLLSGSNIPPSEGLDSGPVQGVVQLFATGATSLEQAQKDICRACGSSGGACSFGGTAFGNQNICVALGISLPRAAAVPSNTQAFYDQAILASQALLEMLKDDIRTADIVTAKAVCDAIYMMMAIGGSQNLLMHIPAMAENAGVYQNNVAEEMGVPNPDTVEWLDVFEFAMGKVGPFVRVTPNGIHRSIDYWFAGGAPEVLCYLDDLGFLHPDRPTAAGRLGDVLETWRSSEERRECRKRLQEDLDTDPNRVILPPEMARDRVLRGRQAARTYVLPSGNLGKGVTKSSAIWRKLIKDGVFSRELPVRVFANQRDLLQYSKDGKITGEEIIVLLNQGLLASGLPENAMLSNFVKTHPELLGLVVLTSARVSGFEGGTVTISQIVPEELEGGPLGKILDGDIVRVSLNVLNGEAHFNLIGEAETQEEERCVARGTEILAARQTRSDVKKDRALTEAAQLLTELMTASGGPFAGKLEPSVVLKVLERERRLAKE